MRTKVIDIEDTMPYEETYTLAQVYGDQLLATADEYNDMAVYYRGRKEWASANRDSGIARELERIGKMKDPSFEMDRVITNTEELLTALREARRNSITEVRWYEKKHPKAKVAQPAAVKPLYSPAVQKDIQTQTDAAIAKYDAAVAARKAATTTAPKALEVLAVRSESTPESD